MTLREKIYAAMTTGTPTLNVWPRGEVPLKPPYPYTTFFVLFRQPEEDLEGLDQDLTHAHVQTDSFSPSETDAQAARDEIRLRMLASTVFTARTLDIPDDWEADTKLHCARGQFSVWVTM